MKEQIIRLESHDDAISVRDKLGWIRTNHVLLVFPDDPRVQILPRRLDLVLIQREATRRNAHLALITQDPLIIEHANELGIAHFPTIQASHRRRWRMQKAQVAVERSEDQIALDPELAEAASRLTPAPDLTPPHILRAIKMTLTGLGVASALGITLFAGPGATIHLSPAANQVAVTTTVTASPDPSVTQVDVSASTIPARSIGVEVEGRATVDTTGVNEEPSSKARGIALFTNLIPDQVTIPTGTIVRTSAAQPVRFITLDDATVPATVGDTVEVPIEALEPGYVGNLPTGRINDIEGPLSTRLAVTNSQPTRGGDVTRVPAVAPSDYNRVLALVQQQLQQRAYAEMQTDPRIALLDTEFIPAESLYEVLKHSETYSASVGQSVDQLTLTMRVTIQGVAIDERRAREIVYARLSEKVGEGFEIIPESLVFRLGEVTTVDEQRQVTFIMQGAGDVSAAIDTGTVRRALRARPVRGAATFLDRELALAAPPVIEMWPAFWPWMPLWALRIDVDVQRGP